MDDLGSCSTLGTSKGKLVFLSKLWPLLFWWVGDLGLLVVKSIGYHPICSIIVKW